MLEELGSDAHVFILSLVRYDTHYLWTAVLWGGHETLGLSVPCALALSTSSDESFPRSVSLFPRMEMMGRGIKAPLHWRCLLTVEGVHQPDPIAWVPIWWPWQVWAHKPGFDPSWKEFLLIIFPLKFHLKSSPIRMHARASWLNWRHLIFKLLFMTHTNSTSLSKPNEIK